MKLFSQKIREAREAAGLSQSALAERCGISARSVTAYETGRARPRGTTVHRLAAALGVSADYLVDDAATDPSAGAYKAPYVEAAREAYGARGAREMDALLEENRALFAGGDITEEEKDAFFRALMTAYLACKRDAQKTFGRK